MALFKKILGIGGIIAALGAGCDKDEDQLVASCEVGPNLQIEVVHHQLKAESDEESIYIIQNGKRIGEITSHDYDNGKFACSNGKILHIEGKDCSFCSLEVYFSSQ